MRRYAIEMIRLLLKYGACADLDGINHERIINCRIDHANTGKALKLERLEGGRLDPYPASKEIVWKSHVYPVTKTDWVIQQLLEASPHSDFQDILSLTDAIWSGNIEGADTILNSTVSSSRNIGLCSRADFCGASSLGVAVFSENENMVKLLLKHGAGLDVPDATGYTPLAIAVHRQNKNIILLLLDNGADITLKDPVLETTVIEQSADSEEALCELMLNTHRCSPHFFKQNSDLLNRLLVRAVRTYRSTLVQLLLECGAAADAKLQGLHGKTPLEFLRSERKHYVSASRCDTMRVLESFLGVPQDEMGKLQSFLED
jgi:ankyrin repeat protein